MTYEGVFFNASKGRYIGRATIDGKRKDIVSDKDETQCALKRNAKLVELLGAEEAAPFLNEIDPDAAQAAPQDAHEEAQEAAPAEAPQAAGIPEMADEYPDDLPFPVTEAQITAAQKSATTAEISRAVIVGGHSELGGIVAPVREGDEEDLRPAPLPDLGDVALRELEAAGVVNLHDSAKRSDEDLFKLRSMTPKNLDRLRAAEVAAGLREDPDAAFMVANGAEPLLTPQDAPKPKKAKVEKPAVTPAPADIDMPMTATDRADFDRLKAEATDSAVKLWRSLAQINERRLYREKFPTFEAFVAQEFAGKGRQWAYQLIEAAKTADALSVIDVQPTTERQARELKKAAKIVTKMTGDEQQIVAQVVKGLTGTDTPSAAQVNAVVEVSSALYASGTIEDPDTGEAVRLSDLSAPRRAALIKENVTNATHERLKRQEAHIAEKGKQNKTLNGTGSTGSAANVQAASWADWLMNYAAQGLSHDHEVRLIVRKDPSGNPQAVAQVVVSATGEVIAEGEPNTRYVKGTVMSLIDRLKYGGEVK